MSCSETCTDASENCPKCHVRRAPLNVGGWCVTCGFNPSHAAELADTQAVLAVAEEMAAFLMAESRALHAVLAPGTRNSPAVPWRGRINAG